MKKKQLILEHSNMMFHSQELIHLQVPEEINLMFYTILILFALIGILIFTVQINDVKKVSGIVKTMENISTVRNVLPGKIDSISYKPEQFVRKGDVLYSLDKEVFSAVKEKLEMDIKKVESQINCVEALLRGFNSEKKDFSQNENMLIFSQMEEFFSTIDYFEEQIGILEHRLLIEKEKPEILRNENDLEEAQRNLNLSKKELEKYKAEYLAKLMQLKNDYEIERNILNRELQKTVEEFSFLEIRAPIDGFVQEISSLNVGDYIFANQEVLNLIPNDHENFRVEMIVGTKDIGEIVPEMTVKYRLAAFPFFEYRGATGKICSIDSDVRQSSEGRLFYQVYADIDKISFENNKGDVYPIKAGIEVDARIVMEKITLAYYILRKLDFI